ncbi:hypothetical protein BC008_07835 [Mastigocoleus testarum BC008]|uniref:N-acetyltransferase domain-containing protein n=2 Tax=Mastigocoleus TaxID=996924 RepID=A0A0V7ZBR4_9CYAN|nr:hypothetical protein BC008_07835 [Mastigocoleus testarum BC008]
MLLARHNLKDVAYLIYESAPELFNLMFGSSKIRYLTHLVQCSNNRFSHQYIRVAERNKQVVGIAIIIPATKLNNNTDYYDILNFSQKLWLKLVQSIILKHVLQHKFPEGTFYISNIAVATEHRNQGIGRQLLLECIAEVSTASGSTNTIFISVDVSNMRAQKLYESLGFKVVETKTINLFVGTIGSRVLSLTVD